MSNKKPKTNNKPVCKIEVEFDGKRFTGSLDLEAVLSNVTPVADKTTVYADGKAVIFDEFHEINPATLRDYTVYGVRIENGNKDPFYSVTYTDAAAGFKPATPTDAGSWADKFPFNAIKPCILRLDGEVEDYLNPNNYAQFADGQPADICDRAVDDVMIEFPKMFYKIFADKQYTYVQISDSPLSLADGFTDAAFSYKGVVRDKFYIGAYKGHIDEYGLLRSLSGKTPTTDKTIGEFRNAAHKCGEGFEIMPYNKLILLQALYLIRYKSLNSQSALGMGYVNSSDWGKRNSGAGDECGMYYGTTSGNDCVKCHGIEDFWGNIYEWVDGLICKDKKLFVADGDFNDAADGYDMAGMQSNTTYGFIKSIKADNKLGFLISEGGADDDTYFSDYGGVCSGVGAVYVACFGGDWSSSAYAGAFVLDVSSAPSDAVAIVGARLCFCG